MIHKTKNQYHHAVVMF